MYGLLQLLPVPIVDGEALRALARQTNESCSKCKHINRYVSLFVTHKLYLNHVAWFYFVIIMCQAFQLPTIAPPTSKPIYGHRHRDAPLSLDA